MEILQLDPNVTPLVWRLVDQAYKAPDTLQMLKDRRVHLSLGVHNTRLRLAISRRWKNPQQLEGESGKPFRTPPPIRQLDRLPGRVGYLPPLEQPTAAGGGDGKNLPYSPSFTDSSSD